MPELLRRYRTAPPVARAVIDVAIDARRLGHPLALSRALLELAAPGYLTDHEWNQARDDWLEQALAYTAEPCHGTPGPVTRIRPRPGVDTPPTSPQYRLADYREQTGRAGRAGVYPTVSSWNAVARIVTEPEVLHQLGQAAQYRNRYGRAAQLYRQAADRGDPTALRALAVLREQAGDWAGAEALYRQADDRGDTAALWVLARRRAGDWADAEALAVQAADDGTSSRASADC